MSSKMLMSKRALFDLELFWEDVHTIIYYLGNKNAKNNAFLQKKTHVSNILTFFFW